jgi:hypothetical protein
LALIDGLLFGCRLPGHGVLGYGLPGHGVLGQGRRLFTQNFECFFKVQGRVGPTQVKSELRHRESNLRLNAHHHSSGSAQARGLYEFAYHPAPESIYHVQRGNIENQRLGMVLGKMGPQGIPKFN